MIDSDLIRGHIDTIILKVLFEGDKYGYEICKEVEEKSGGTYELKQPTLYSCLKRLENQGLISSYWKDSDIGGKRHYYKLTVSGKDTYKKNQEDWLRSRQIIDNLISNTYEDASSFALVKKQDIEELEKRVEIAEEKVEELENKEDYAPIPNLKEVSFDEEEKLIPWNQETENKLEETSEDKNEESVDLIEDEESVETYNWLNDNLQDTTKPVIVNFAPNGEIVAVEEKELTENDIKVEEISEDIISPAQGTLFEEQDLVFDEVKKEESEVDILELLGHTQKVQIDYEEPKLIEEPKKHQETIVEDIQEIIVEDIQEEPVSPFNFKMEDFVIKSKNSYFETEENITSDYVAPEMKIDGLNEDNKKELNVEAFEAEEEKIAEDSDVFLDTHSPVYHDFGASHFLNIQTSDDEDDIYVDESNIDEDEIYLNPEAKNDYKQESSIFAEESDELKLFTKDIFEENNEFEETEKVSVVENEDLESFNEIIRPVNNKPMDFYKSTENYDTLSPKYTDEEYKEKLSTLMSYGGGKEEFEEKNINYSFNNIPKDYNALKTEFEKEGLTVRTHNKMVKESKSTRSYIESNKLNLINSWTSFGFISFILTMVFLIMNNYKNSSYNFSYKYFIIGIAILAIIPLIYTLLYFINPYKKKPARYASRIYLLFALLLTVQLMIIIYCINLQLGFYSFSQENYNHLLWIIPSILALYPIFDAILHTLYFNSKNFHI